MVEPSDTRTARIVGRSDGVGIDRDARLLADALGEAFPGRSPVTFSGYRTISPFRRFLGRRNAHETLVFLARVTSRWLRHAGRYVLIPNQERHPHRLVPALRRHVDHVLCKTEHAKEIFARVHPSVHLLGFTSPDRRLDGERPDFGRFLHLAGGSALKGTDDVLALWRRHPEWPPLTLVLHRRGAIPEHVPANVDLVDRYLSDDELRRIQNRCGIHLCPSRSEGWGHYIGEALSCGAVTVTTDAPPMNELVGPDRGILVSWTRSEPRKMGTNFYVDRDALEAAVEGVLERPRDELEALGRRGREWFERNDADFRRRVGELWRALEL